MLKKKNTWIPALAFLIVCYAMACAYMALYGNNILDADMSSELVLAKLLSDEGSIISKNWYYSTELRVLNTQLVFAPLFAITDNWLVVRSVGTAILLAILVLCYLFMARSMHFLWADTFVTAGILLLPLSNSYTYSVLTGIYYVPHICISFVLFGLICRYVEDTRHRILNCVFVAVLAFVSGLGGVRQLFVFTIPAALAAALLWVKGRLNSANTKKDDRFFVVCALALISSGIGYIVNKKVLAGIYHFADYGENQYRTTFQSFSTDGLQFCINSVMELFGYHQGDLFSLLVIYNLLFALILAVSYFALRTVLKKVKRDDNYPVFVAAVYFCVAFIMLCALFCFTDIERVVRYFVPVVVFLIPIIAYACIRCKEPLGQKPRNAFVAFFMTLLVLCSVNTYRNSGKYDTNSELKEIISVALDEGYTQGCSSFWSGNEITELSNGKIEMWLIGGEVGDAIIHPYYLDKAYEWLQSTEHSTALPEGRFFLLLSTLDLKYIDLDIEPVYSTASFKLYGFDSYADYEVLLQAEYEAYMEQLENADA